MKRHFALSIIPSVFFILLMLPFASMVIYSLFSVWTKEMLMPQGFTVRGFIYLLEHDLKTAVLSVLFSLLAGFLSLIAAVFASEGLLLVNGRIKRVIEMVFYLPMLLPVISVTIASHRVFLGLSLKSGHMIFLMHLFFSFPYVFRMVYTSARVLGRDCENAARNLGASELSVFFGVHLPVYAKTYASALSIGFIISYTQYFVNLYLGGADNINYSMVTDPYVTGSDRNMGSAYVAVFMILGGAVMVFCHLLPKVLFWVYGKRTWKM